MARTRRPALPLFVLALGCACSSSDDGGGQSNPPSPAKVAINEVAPAGSPADWVELYNYGDEEILLDGWTMGDSDPLHVYAFDTDAHIAAGGYELIAKDATGSAGSFTFGLGQEDSVTVLDAELRTVDSVAWESGAAPAGTSWGRVPDGTGDFERLLTPTPGKANTETEPTECGDGVIEWGEACEDGDFGGDTCDSLGFLGGTLACESSCKRVSYAGCETHPSTVVINEVTSSGSDRIEIFNVGDEEVDLVNWQLVDERPDKAVDVFRFPAGAASIIPAGGYLLLYKDDHHAFGLGADDLVALRDPDGGVIDIADWPLNQANLTYCRLPNGTGGFVRCTIPSFGAENEL